MSNRHAKTRIAVQPAPPRVPGSKRRSARTLTGRAEDEEPGTLAIRAMQEAEYTDGRPAFDRFDAMSKL